MPDAKCAMVAAKPKGMAKPGSAQAGPSRAGGTPGHRPPPEAVPVHESECEYSYYDGGSGDKGT